MNLYEFHIDGKSEGLHFFLCSKFHWLKNWSLLELIELLEEYGVEWNNTTRQEATEAIQKYIEDFHST